MDYYLKYLHDLTVRPARARGWSAVIFRSGCGGSGYQAKCHKTQNPVQGLS